MSNLTAESLAEFSIFKGLNNDQITKFVGLIKLDSVEQGNDIIKEGEVGDTLIFLFEGEVSITKALTLMTNKTDVDTREKEMTRLDSKIRPVFGEMSLFNEHDTRTATINALSDCQIGVIHSGDFFSICDNDTHIGNIVMRNVAGQMAGNLRKTNQQVLKLTTAFSLILEN